MVGRTNHGRRQPLKVLVRILRGYRAWNAIALTWAFVMLVGYPVTAIAAGADPATSEVVKVLNDSAAAFERGDLAAASKTWSNSERLTVFEGGHVNNGWTDYRDNHLGPEMKELRRVRYRLSNVVAHVVGHTAWATFRYSISGRERTGRAFAGTGIGTAILERGRSGWRIVHWHSTSTPKRTPRSPATRPRL